MKYCLAIFLTFAGLVSNAQAHDPNMQKNAVVFNSNMTPTSLVRTKPKNKERLKGSPYLFLKPKKGKVKIKGVKKEYVFESMRYNAWSREIEIYLEDQIRFIRGMDLEGFTIHHNGKELHFVRADKYNFEGSKLLGFIQLVEDGQLKLFKKLRIGILGSNYSIALNIGHNYDRLIRKIEYFFGKKEELFFIKRKKYLYRYFSNSDFDARAFLKQNKLRYRKYTEQALQQVVKAYNVQLANK